MKFGHMELHKFTNLLPIILFSHPDRPILGFMLKSSAEQLSENNARRQGFR